MSEYTYKALKAIRENEEKHRAFLERWKWPLMLADALCIVAGLCSLIWYRC